MSAQIDAVRRYFKAYETSDRAMIEPLLADGFIFSSPYDDHIGRAAYFARCWPTSEKVRGYTLERLVEDGDEVFVRYLMETIDGKRMRNMELFRFEDGKIMEVDVYFGRNL